MEDDEDNPTLPADTLALLQNFYTDRDASQKQFEDLKTTAEEEFDGNVDGKEKEWSIDAFAEDWNASQFWYTDDTARTIARALLEGAGEGSAVAVVSAPSVYVQLKKLLSTVPSSSRPMLRLLEYDVRFAVFGPESVAYDFANPLRLPAELKGKFDRIVCDPPFLSEDCQTKAALTVRWLAKLWQKPDVQGSEDGIGESGEKQQQRVIVCTGERMEDLVLRLYGKAGVRTTEFLPQHSKGLSNEFRCYANCPVGESG